MISESNLSAAGRSLRDHPIPPPPPVEAIQRRGRAKLARRRVIAVTAVIALGVLSVGVFNARDRHASVTVGTPSPTALPAPSRPGVVQSIRRGAIDIVGGGPFRLITTPGRMVDATEDNRAATSALPTGGTGTRIQSLEVTDDQGRHFRLSVFDSPTETAALDQGSRAKGAPRERMGPARDAVVVDDGEWQDLVWPYDATRVISFGSTPDNVEVRGRLAASIVSADRIPPESHVATSVPDVSGLGYLEAARTMTQKGANARWSVVYVAPGSTVTGTVIGTEPPAGTAVAAKDLIVIKVAFENQGVNPGAPGQVIAGPPIPHTSGLTPAETFVPWATSSEFGASGTLGFSRSDEEPRAVPRQPARDISESYPLPLRFISGEFVGFALWIALPLDELVKPGADLTVFAASKVVDMTTTTIQFSPGNVSPGFGPGFCAAWKGVLDETAAGATKGGSFFSEKMDAGMKHMATEAPADVAADLRALGDLWRAGTVDQRSGDIMMRVLNRANAACPGIGP